MSYLSRNGYYPKLYVNGRRIPDAQIDGAAITVTRTESDDAQMVVKLRPSTGLQNFALYQGLSIILDIQTSATQTDRIFTGLIDIDEYDLLNESITLRCTDNRSNLIKTIPSVVGTIGYYSETVFGIASDTYEECTKRLETIPYSFDFDAYGNYYLVAWQPKASADYTLGDSDVYRRTPTVRRTQRAQITNSVTIKLKYTFERQHHRENSYTWDNNVTACDFLVYGYSLCSKDMVREAANSAGWPLKAAISFTPVYASGFYRCAAAGSAGGTVSIGWLGTNTAGVNYVNKQESVVDGVATATVSYDSAGNTLISTATDANVNASYSFCIGAAWTATTRFTQNITEDYTLTVTAPQSIAQYGAINTTNNYSISDRYDASTWENYKAYTSQPSGAVSVTSPNGAPISDYFVDQSTDRSLASTALQTALHYARTKIIKSHRQNRVTVQTRLRPELDLRHTIALSCTKITAKGKVYSLKHHIDIGEGADAWTEVELAMSKSTGSASDSALSIPTAPTYVPSRTGAVARLQSHYGVDPSNSGSGSSRWTGHVGNKYVSAPAVDGYGRPTYTTFKTTYPEMFIVDTPAVEDSFRATKMLSAAQSYTITIPDDALTITFDGKLS